MKTNQLSPEFLKPAKGEQIVNVVGLGPTRKYFNPNDGNISIGVNDIFRFAPVDYLCCTEPTSDFKVVKSENRNNKLKYIIEGSHQVKAFYTDWPDVWEKVKASNIKPFYTISHFEKQKGQLPAIFMRNMEFLPFSYDSTYTAAVLAFSEVGATKIIMYGVDFNDHTFTKHRFILGNLYFNYYVLKMELERHGCQLVVYSKESGLCEVLDYIIDPWCDFRKSFEILNDEYKQKELKARHMINKIEGLKDGLFIRCKTEKDLRLQYNLLINEIMKYL